MKNIKRAVLLWLVGFTFILPVFSTGAVSAITDSTGGGTAPAQNAGLEELVKAHLFFNTLAYCLSQAPLDDDLNSPDNDKSEAAATSWNWFKAPSPVAVSPLYDTVDSNVNGTSSCSFPETISGGFAALGITDPIDAMCKTGFAFGHDATNTCENDFAWTFRGYSDTATRFKTYMNQSYYGKDSSSAPAWTDAQLYYLASQSIFSACTVSEVPASAKGDSQVYMLKTPTADKPDSKTYYKTGYGSTSVAWETSPNAFTPMKYTCAQLFTEANKHAAGFATYIKNHPDDTSATGDPSSSTGTTGSNDPSGDGTVGCEASSWSFNWIFCGVYEGLSNLIGWILEHLIVPLLQTSPLCISSSGTGCVRNDPVYKVWSSFRIYGDIFLVIALLVVVFGQAIGGGLVDAYTAKKVLPRLLLAGILINLSIYIVAALVDITNILGGGIGQIITAPLNNAGAFKISASGGVETQSILGGAVAGGALLGAGQMAGLLSISGMSMVMDVILIPVLLIFLAILVVLAIRKAAIIALVFIAPVAFALYCLPNTEKYFKKWWDTLLQMLMVYPIVILMFAVSSILSVTVMANGSQQNSLQQSINYLVSFIFLIIPLVLIPFSIKIAGGVVGKVFDAVDGGRQKLHSLGQGRRERSTQGFKNANVQARQKRYSALMGQAAKRGAVGRAVLGTAARTYGGYNVEAEASATRAAVAKQLNDQIATGDDAEIRALTVNKRTALQGRGVQWSSTLGQYADMNGNAVSSAEAASADFRTDKNGTRQFRTLGGAWANEASVDRAYKRWGNDTFAQQTALSYEMRKALDEGQVQGVGTGYANVAKGWGMNDQQAGGAWIGAAFENQNQHLEYKSVDWKDGGLKHDGNNVLGGGLVDEIYEKRGSYNVAQMGSNTVEQLKQSYQAAQGVGDTDTMEKIQAISETFMNEMGGGQIGQAGDGADAQPINGPAGADGRRRANTPGSAHTAERVRELASMTGIYANAPTGPYSDPNHAPSPNRREQS